jgi:hypothetical protein
MKKALSVLCVLCVTTLAFPQQAQWAKAYSGANQEFPTSLLLKEDGSMLVLGFELPLAITYQEDQKIWLMKISPKGMEAARWFFDSQNPEADYKSEAQEKAPVFRKVEDGGYIIAGSIVSRWTVASLSKEYRCAFFVKFSEDLQIEWQRFLGDDDWQTQEAVNDLLVTPDGGYIAVGSTSSSGLGGDDFWLIKLDSAGEVVWQKAYGGKEDDEAHLIAQTPDGGFWVMGVSGSFPSGSEDPEEPAESNWIRPQSSESRQDDPQEQYDRTWILRLSAEGAVVWQRAYSWGYKDRFHSMLLTSDDGCILAGETIEDWGEEIQPDTNILLIKLDAEGGPVWQRTFGEEDSERITHLIPKGEYKFLAVGNLKSGEDQDMCILQITKTGHLDWVTSFGAESVAGAVSLEHGAAVAWTEDNEILVAGSTGLLGAQQDDFLLLRLSEEGLVPNCEFSRALDRFPFRDLEVLIEDTHVEFTAAEVGSTAISFNLTSVPVQVIRDVCAAKKNLVRR